MKKYVNLVSIILVVLFLILTGSYSNAATSTLSTNKGSVTEGDTITVTVKVNAAQWNLTLTADGKALNTWTETVNYKENLSKTFTASYKTSKKGTVTFKLTGDITDVNQTNTEINESKSVTVNAKQASSSGSSTSSGNTGSPSSGSSSGSSSSGSSGSSTTTQKPTFKSVNKKVYTTGTVNLRSSWSTSSSAVQVAKGTELTLTGTSTEKIGGYVWYRVTYNGSTKYVASSLITETKPEEEPEKSSNNNLSSLEVEGIVLSPSFSENTLKYEATVGDDVNSLSVNAKAKDSKATVKIEGNESISNGENTIKITVTAEDGKTKTYNITVTKNADTNQTSPAETTNPADEDSDIKLKTLSIAGVDFENGFDSNKFSYELNLNLAVESLNITAEPNQEDARVEILGNEGFKEGENLVTIMVTSASGTKTATYQIKVNMPKEATQNQNILKTTLICIGVVLAIILVAMVVRIVVIKKREYDEEDDDEIEGDSDNIPTRTRMEDKLEDDDFLYTTSAKDSSKKSKGKHSV